MSQVPLLDEGIRARALPAGSAQYWSHLFAAPEFRQPLLGVYALSAEWNALLDPATEPSVAQLKFAWWQEEMQRLSTGRAVHPISLFLASLPQAAPPLFEPLQASVQAAALEAGGVPLERLADLAAHAGALSGNPLRVAARLAAAPQTDAAATLALAEAQYWTRALRGYARAARHGRIVFPVDELMNGGIDNAALSATTPSAPLFAYLEQLRLRAVNSFAAATAALPRGNSSRHLAVLAALGVQQLRGASVRRWAPLKDMLSAWAAARRSSF